jgi:uncharacterized protein YqhQ
MAKREAEQKKHKVKEEEPEEREFSDSVNRTFKIIVRIMSWIVGIVFLLIIILPQFNSPALDKFTQVIFYTGMIDLIIVIIIEFSADSFKSLLNRMLHGQDA